MWPLVVWDDATDAILEEAVAMLRDHLADHSTAEEEELNTVSSVIRGPEVVVVVVMVVEVVVGRHSGATGSPRSLEGKYIFTTF